MSRSFEKIFIFLDAYDEYPKRRTRILLNTIKSLFSDKVKQKLYMCITTRPPLEDDLTEKFQGARILKISAPERGHRNLYPSEVGRKRTTRRPQERYSGKHTCQIREKVTSTSAHSNLFLFPLSINSTGRSAEGRRPSNNQRDLG
jgi:hypothetical protein